MKKSALVFLLVLAAAPQNGAAFMDNAPGGTLHFSDRTSKHLKSFTINGCLYQGMDTGISFPSGKAVLNLATAKGELSVPVSTLKRITFTLTTGKSSCGAPVYEVKVSRLKGPVLAGWLTIGNLWEDKTKWSLDDNKKDDLRRLKELKAIVFDPPPKKKAAEPDNSAPKTVTLLNTKKH